MSADLVLQKVKIPNSVGLYDVVVCDGRINEIMQHDHTVSTSNAVVLLDGGEDWLIPGWIDLQVNDIEWLNSAMSGAHKEIKDHAERIEQVLHYQLKQGVTHLILVCVLYAVGTV